MLNKLILFLLILTLTSLEARRNDMFAKEKAENLRYNKTIRAFMHKNKHITDLVYNAYAYVAFPSIVKGGVLFGYAHGEGRAYLRGGVWTGNVTISQYSVGLQAGGQVYSEIIFFKTLEAFEAFKKGGLEESTQVSLTPFISGLSADVNFDKDVEVYTSVKGGLMLDASTGTQSFEYKKRKRN